MPRNTPAGTHVVVAGGGTAGHIEPAMNLADALRRRDPEIGITALGTETGMENTLVPARGYTLRHVPRVPLPRKPSIALFRLPGKLRGAVKQAGQVLDEVGADVVVGFGGYVSVPAYLAARKRKLPIVVHEANARAGVANRLGARMTKFVATTARAQDLPHGRLIGLPLRRAISTLDRAATRPEARAHFGLDPDRPTLLVFGGSLGAKRLNDAATGAAEALRAAGIQVLHSVGREHAESVKVEQVSGEAPYVVVPYLERMDLAYAAADVALCRAGAMTCAELAAVGLPAVYVPLPIGNGEQRRNALPVVEAGGGLVVEDSAVNAAWITENVVPLAGDPVRVSAMGAAAAAHGRRDADEALVDLVLEALGSGAGRQNGTGGVVIAIPEEIPAADKLGRVHFVGIGGAGMSGIARILLARGVTVSGSDAKDSTALAALRALGARVHVGHEAGQVGDADTVVVSTAIRESNPELAAARADGRLVLPRAAALASVMAGRRAVAVAGTHGKTTTTSMLTVALQHCGADPSFAIGGSLNESGANAHDGSGDVFVAEADESDGSFLLYSPDAAIVTNVEADHLDHYGTAEAVEEAFVRFSERITAGGFLVVCADDPGSRQLGLVAAAAGVDVRTYGLAEDSDVRLEGLTVIGGGGYAFESVANGRRLGAIELQVPGAHNALNAAAALSVGIGLGFSAADLREGLSGFTGTRRRFELKGTRNGIRVYDDYAHHPTELEAVLKAAREVALGGRLVVAFQPHRYSRTAAFTKEFGTALGLADQVVVMDVYAASEDPIPGVSGAAVAAAVPLPPGDVIFEPSWTQVAARLAERAAVGDLVLTLGAGDITMIGPEVLELLGPA